MNMAEKRDLYEVLGVSKQSDERELDDDAAGDLGDGRDEATRPVGHVRAVVTPAADQQKAFVGLERLRSRDDQPVFPLLSADLVGSPP